MVATREKWQTEPWLPQRPSNEQMLEFFGIPPHSAEALENNIAKKRQYFNHKSNGGNPVGRKKAEEVLELIQRISLALTRGATDQQGGGAQADIPDSVFETLEDLWRILSEYVFVDDFDQAITVAREAVNRWHNADAAGALAWVVSTVISSDGFAAPALLVMRFSPGGLAGMARAFAVSRATAMTGRTNTRQSPRGCRPPTSRSVNSPANCATGRAPPACSSPAIRSLTRSPLSTRLSAQPAAGSPPCSTSLFCFRFPFVDKGF